MPQRGAGKKHHPMFESLRELLEITQKIHLRNEPQAAEITL